HYLIHIFFLYASGAHRDLPSFPTRRSSDLGRVDVAAQIELERDARAALRARRVRRGEAGDRRKLLLERQRHGRGHGVGTGAGQRSEEHTSELQSQSNLVCRLLLEKKKTKIK